MVEKSEKCSLLVIIALLKIEKSLKVQRIADGVERSLKSWCEAGVAGSCQISLTRGFHHISQARSSQDWVSPRRVYIMSLPSVLPRLRIPESDSSSLPRGQSYRRTGAQHMQPSLSPVDIQSHLYNSLLEARTADVALRVRGTWEAVYRLHRVVLIQAVSLATFFSLLIVLSLL